LIYYIVLHSLSCILVIGIQFAFDDFVPDVPVPSTSYEPAPVVAEQPAKKQRGKKADAEPATKKAQTKAAAAKQIELTLPSSAAAAATAAAVYEAALPPAKRSRKGTTVVEQSAAAVAVRAVAAALVCNVTECAGQANWMCGVQACMKSLSYWCFMHQHHASHCNMQFRIPIEQTVESGFLNPGTTPQVTMYVIINYCCCLTILFYRNNQSLLLILLLVRL